MFKLSFCEYKNSKYVIRIRSCHNCPVEKKGWEKIVCNYFYWRALCEVNKSYTGIVTRFCSPLTSYVTLRPGYSSPLFNVKIAGFRLGWTFTPCYLRISIYLSNRLSSDLNLLVCIFILCQLYYKFTCYRKNQTTIISFALFGIKTWLKLKFKSL